MGRTQAYAPGVVVPSHSASQDLRLRWALHFTFSPNAPKTGSYIAQKDDGSNLLRQAIATNFITLSGGGATISRNRAAQSSKASRFSSKYS
jgi:hypothetical protein